MKLINNSIISLWNTLWFHHYIETTSNNFMFLCDVCLCMDWINDYFILHIHTTIDMINKQQKFNLFCNFSIVLFHFFSMLRNLAWNQFEPNKLFNQFVSGFELIRNTLKFFIHTHNDVVYARIHIHSLVFLFTF
mgnify:CR=1 FL=1